MRESVNSDILAHQNKIESMFPKFLRITYVIIYLCTIFVSYSLDLLTEEETVISAGVVDYIAINLGTAPISEVIFSDDNSKSILEYEKLSIYNWPGAKKEESEFFSTMNFLGTRKTTQENISNVLKSQVPAYFPVSSNNKQIILGRPHSLYNWGKKSFFIKRNENFFYKPSHKKCGNGYIECSPNLCISQTEKCPINSFTLNDQDLISISQEKNSTQTPLFNIEISMLGKPCYALGTTPRKDNAFEGLFIINGCGAYGQDNSAEIISSKNEIILFQENNLLDVLHELPNYREKIKNDEAYLVARQQIPLADECYQAARPESPNFQKTLNMFKAYGDVHLGIQINALIALTFTLLIKNKEFLTLLDTTCFISLFLTIWTLWVICYNISRLKEIDSLYFLIEHQCFFDSNFSQALIDFKAIVNKVTFPLYMYSLALFVIAFMQAVVYFYARRSRIYSSDPNNLRRIDNQSNRESEIQQHIYTVPLLDGISQNYDVRMTTRRTDAFSRQEMPTRTESVEMNVLNANKEKVVD